MENLANELNKLKIDKSQRSERQGAGKFWVLVGIPVAVAAGLLIFNFRPSTTTAKVDVVRPRLETSSQSAVLVATGYVVPHHKIQVGSKIAGRVAWIGVEKGNHVVQGQTVVRLEDLEYRAQYEQARSAYDAAQAHLTELERGSRPQEIERAKAELDRAQAQLRTDEAQLKRIEGLVKEGVASTQLLDEARGHYDTSRADVGALTHAYELIRLGPRQEQIDNARAEAARAKAAVDYARTMLDATEIHVPSNGTILERNVERGEMVTTSFVGDQGAKSFVVTLADLTDLQVELDINQNDFNRISPNQKCTVVTDAYPDRVYNCVVYEIAPEANRQKATVQVKVKFSQPDQYVRPEMNARVTFLEPEKSSDNAKADPTKLYIVPKRTLVDRDSGNAVLVVAGGKVQVKPVIVKKEVGQDAYISSGLVGSEKVIADEQLSQLKPGDRVDEKTK